MAIIKFVQGSAASFAGLAEKDINTLYFITDERRIYKGNVPFSGGIYKTVTTFPATGELNVIYVNTTNGEARYWNGTAYQQIVRPSSTAITGAGDDLHFPTTKAIVDYVTQAIADQDLSAITNRLSTVEGQITIINGTGAGSLSKTLADAKTYADGKVTALSNGQVTTNKNNIASLQTAVDGKANKATTLSGYGITNAYTKTETDTAITTAIANVDHLKREIVDNLPSVASADENTIYMVPKSGGSGEQSYNEYMLINNVFEKIGDSTVDLSNYATKTEVSTAKSEAISTAGTNADSKISTKVGDVGSGTVKQYVDSASTTTLNSAKTYADGLGSKYATSAQGGKADSALQSADVVSGSTNGTIAVKGTNVAVKGLGSAAYVATTTFDNAGSATTALNSANSYTDSQTALTLNNAKSYTDTSLTWGTL